MSRLCYIDGSISTLNVRGWFDRLGTLYQQADWIVYEFSTNITPFVPGKFQRGGTNWQALIEHIDNGFYSDVIIYTDDTVPGDVHTMLDDRDARVVIIRSENDALVALSNASGKGMWANAFVNALRGKTAILDEFHSKKDLFGPIDLTTYKYVNPSRPQEAHMNTRPTIVTTVSLDRSRATVQPTIADLKTLIAEVERVGGDDNSTVQLDHDSYRWNVTLSVKANEVETSTIPTPDEIAALLDEYRTTGTTAARKKEIKARLGL